MRFGKRALLSSVMSLPLAAMLQAAASSSASAQESADTPVADLNCVISGTADINPGIGLLSQPQKLSGKVQGGTEVSPATPCTSATGVPYQGFTMTLSGTGSMACTTAALEGGLGGKGKVTWDNGDTSAVDWSITTVGMVPVVDVTLTDGALSGARVAVAGVPNSITGNCALDPITSLGFAGDAEIARLSS